MDAVNITVNVNCYQPSWVFTDITKRFLTPVYRIYLNNDLLTERTWLWNNDNFIRENIWVYAEINSSHRLTIEPILKNPKMAVFSISNIIVINSPAAIEQINEQTVSFTL
jgi:hypothetical protein